MVSVIIPAYNTANYIKRCIDSLREQSYTDLQVIFVDDGSNDNTLDEIQKENDGRLNLKIIHKENGGIASARNEGLKYVKGDYIFFFDSDDFLEKDSIRALVNVLEENDCDWVSCQYSRWNEDGSKLKDYDFITGKRDFETDKDRVNFAINELLSYHVGFEVWDKMYRTDIIRDNHLTFSDICYVEDISFNLKYLMNCKNLICIPDRCVRYVIRRDSVMRKEKDLPYMLEQYILMLDGVKQYFKEDFALIFAKLMDNAYISYTPVEVIDAYKKLNDVSMVIDTYREIRTKNIDIKNIYHKEIADIKVRYHMYVYEGLVGFTIKDRLKWKLYDIYRCLRGRDVIRNWKMPY